MGRESQPTLPHVALVDTWRRGRSENLERARFGLASFLLFIFIHWKREMLKRETQGMILLWLAMVYMLPSASVKLFTQTNIKTEISLKQIKDLYHGPSDVQPFEIILI